jgi:hypothetical protein
MQAIICFRVGVVRSSRWGMLDFMAETLRIELSMYLEQIGYYN